MNERVAWGRQSYAGFWRRFVGLAVDVLVYLVFALAVGIVLGFAIGLRSAAGGAAITSPEDLNGLNVVLQVFFTVVYAVYDVGLTHRYGGTLGKRAVGIEVRTADGDLASVPRLIGRYFARTLSALPLLLGYLWAGWDEQKQTWHDKLAGTYVVRSELTQAIAPEGTTVAPAPAWQASAPPAWSPSSGTAGAAGGQPGSAAAGTTVVDADDPNMAAVARAGLDRATAGWLREVAGQVDLRLDRVADGWRDGEQADAARACVFGLLLGKLAQTYPERREQLSAVAERHPSFSSLLAGSRLATLEQIAADPVRIDAWVGPLIDVRDPDRMRSLVE